MKTLLTIATISAASLTAGAATAASVNIIGGVTEVTVTAPLGALGLTGAPSGTATAEVVGGLPVFSFPITGGIASTTSPNAIINHDGAGVTLTADLPADTTAVTNMVSATVGNFVINTELATVFGTVNDGTEFLPFFTFGEDTDLPGVELEISATLAGALTSVFAAPDLTGATFGYAVPAPQVAPVPLPAGLPLLAGALLAFGLVRRKAA